MFTVYLTISTLLLFFLTFTAFPSHALLFVTFWIQLVLLVYMWVWSLYTLECGQPHARGHSSWKKNWLSLSSSHEMAISPQLETWPLEPVPWPHWNIDLLTLVQVLCMQPQHLWVHHVLSCLEDTVSLHSTAPNTLTPTVSPSSLPQCPLSPVMERMWYRCSEGWILHSHLKTLL